MTATDRHRDLSTLHAIYRVARVSPRSSAEDTVRRLLPNADEVTLDAAVDAATIGAIHGVTDTTALTKAELGDRLAAKGRGLLCVETALDEDRNEP